MTRRRAILAILAASTHALPRDAVLAIARDDDVCPSKDLVACSSALPSGFCCPRDAQCQALAGNTTALCCPGGSSCDRIRPIGCDVRLQDPASHADAVVITSVFDVKLEACGGGCCPFGYACDSGQCVLGKDQSKKPGADGKSTTTTTTTTTSGSSTISASSSTAATTTTPASSLHTTASASATATPTSSDGAAADEKGIKSNTMSVIGGVAGGALVLLILVIVAVLYLRRRRRRGTASAAQQHEKSTGYRAGPPSSTASRGLNISEPIVQQESSYRTDFMLKSPSAQSSISNQPVNSRWSGSGVAARARNLTPSRPPPQQPAGARRHLSIPNPFTSPNPSTRSARRESSGGSSCDGDGDDDQHLKTGHVVNGRLAPIRGMRSSKRVSRRTEPQLVRREASGESINVFADENAVPPLQQQQRGRNVHDEAQNRMTTFSDLMEKAELGDVHRGKRYVPGTTPRI